MNIEKRLYAALAPLCARVFPDVAPIETPRPYVMWQQIGGQSPSFLERGVANMRNARIQISVWADSRMAANTLALAIEKALAEDATMQASAESALVALYESEMRLYGALQDFTIWTPRE